MPEILTPTLANHVVKGSIKRMEFAELNEEQRRVHDIIEEHLKEHMTSKSHGHTIMKVH